MPDITRIVEAYRPNLGPYETIYKHLHQNPEISLQESQTAAFVAKHISAHSKSSYEIHSDIGGHGLAAVFRNGQGKTVLLRSELDALPVEEKTGLPYASKVTMKDNDGITKPVMHACGHDMHMTCMLAAAELLYEAHEKWRGTLIILFQPNEERGAGAQAMVDDDLYSKIPVPDVVLGQHVMPARAGSLGTRVGLMGYAADSFCITIYGSGGHASQPHRAIDPVVMAALVIVRLQTIVSREVDPWSGGAVVTVGSVQAGSVENVIADHAVLKLTIRTANQETRERALKALHRIVRAECEASGAPKEPLFESTFNFPLGHNDEEATRPLEKTFATHFGDSYSPTVEPLGGSEDFSILGKAVKRPCSFWSFGGADPELWDEAVRKGRTGEDISGNHSPFFGPVVQPTMKTGVDALAVAALTFLAT
ncbi:MAG: hypothetical protein M1827_007325 [Pycnora praestabilis]|nr:MAG: hypothetical protein M1827_007325 [Pycnora praestabilis]